MDSTYQREIEHAQRDAIELSDLLQRFEDSGLSRQQLMTAIGLATNARVALLRAAAAREESAG